jgi:hypothetical protein
MKPILLAVVLAFSPALFAGDDPAVVGHLETARHNIVVWAGDQPRYTVRTKDGQVLAEKIPLRELSAKFPELHRAVDGSYAIWAGL